MSDSIPAPSDRTVVVQRHSALTYISLGFNALVLVFILFAIAHDHHRKNMEMRDGGRPDRQEWGDRGHDQFGHRDFGGMGGPGWRHRDHEGRGSEACPACEDHGSDFSREGDFPPRGNDRHPDFDGERSGFGRMGHGPMTPPSAEAMTDRFMLALTEKLQLSDDESAKVRPLVHDGIAQFQKDMQAQKEAHQKMLEQTETKVRAVLTPDQQKKFDEMLPAATPPAK